MSESRSWLWGLGNMIKNTIMSVLDANKDNEINMGDFPRLLQLGQSIVSLAQATGNLMGSSGETKAAAVDTYISEGFEIYRNNRPIINTDDWKRAKELQREVFYLMVSSLEDDQDLA